MSENSQQEDEKKINDGRPYIAIMVQEDKTIKIVGSLEDPIVAFGLIQAANHILGRSFTMPNQSPLLSSRHGIIDFLRNGKR